MRRPLHPPEGRRAHLPDALRGLGVTDALRSGRVLRRRLRLYRPARLTRRTPLLLTGQSTPPATSPPAASAATPWPSPTAPRRFPPAVGLSSFFEE